MLPAMSRAGIVVAVVVVAATGGAASVACSKSAGNQEAAPASGASDGKPMPMTVGEPGGSVAPKPAGGPDDRLRLHADEGTLAITPPADAKAGAEAIVTILVTPKTGYHVNTEFPIKLTLDAPPSGVTLARTEWKAGGSSKDKGDADALDEQHLALSIKMTAAASGTYTLNGSFKFAVCDHDSCLAKKEPIAITVAAK
jgi:hypothetical protein